MRTIRTLRWFVRCIVTILIPALVFSQMGPALATAQRIRQEEARHKPNPNAGLPKGEYQALSPALRKKVEAKLTALKNRPQPDVRKLTTSELHTLKGRGPYRNPYFDGIAPWQKAIRDVNTSTGNLFKSFTDIQVSPARGAGLVMQRTYNSNDGRIGPFGVGWTHAYDIRVEEASDVANQADNSAVDATINDVPRTDFFGGKHTYHRDADGLYSPPSYMFDEMSSDYEYQLENGPTKVDDDTDVGSDGTIKHYTNVLTNADGTDGNLRACDYIEDRHGNKTTLTYGQSITLPSGATEKLLTKVADPSGRQLAFTWTNLSGSNTQPAWRITQIQGPLDPSGNAVAGVTLTVAYGYYTDPNESNAANDLYNLHTVTLDPGGLNRVTTYTYTGYTDTAGTENGLLSSITDPAGETTSYGYSAYNVDQGNGPVVPAGYKWYYPTGTVWVTQITEPGGVDSNNNPRNLIWYLFPMFSSPSIMVWNTGNAFAWVESDQELRENYIALEPFDGDEYAETYDNDNNVVTHMAERLTGPLNPGYGANPIPYPEWYSHKDIYTFGTVGNQLTHSVSNWPQQETSTWYNLSQYFQKSSVTDYDGHKTSYIVGTDTDANTGNRGSVLAVQDPGYNDSTSPSYQKETTYTYNQYGQKTSETNLNGVVTNYTYGDAYGNLTQVAQDPTGLNRVTTMTYDLAGRVLSATDPNNNTTQTQYNVVGQPTTMKVYDSGNNLKETISYSYDANGRTTSVTDHRGTTSIAYESGCDRIHSVTDPVTGTTSYTYLITGERASMTLPGGGTWTYSYNVGSPVFAQLTPATVSYSDQTTSPIPTPTLRGAEWIFGKDGDLNSITPTLSQITDDQNRIEVVGLNEAGWPVSIDFDMTFNGSGNPTSFCQTNYGYQVIQFPGIDGGSGNGDTQPWLHNLVTTWHGLNSQGGSVSRIISESDYTYDNKGMRKTNMTSVQSVDSTGNGVVDGNGNPVWASQRTETYGYDDLSRLSTVNYGDGETQSYTFDAMGNRLQLTDSINGTTNYTYNSANMLTSAGGNTYTNDADGNTLTGGGRTNTWDNENRLVQCVNSSSTSQYDYGSDGLRRQQSVTASGTTTVTDYGLDGDNVVREWTVSNGSLTPASTYFAGQRGIEYKRFDGTGAVDWYVYDGLGSVVDEVDANGSVTASEKYDVYGVLRGSVGASQTSHHFVGNLGHASDQATGLIYMRARYYDPLLGRFISMDPGQNGQNWLIYANQSPTNKIDRNGKDPSDPSWWVSLGQSWEQNGPKVIFSGLVTISTGLATLRAGQYLELVADVVSDTTGVPATDLYGEAATMQMMGGAGIIAGFMQVIYGAMMIREGYYMENNPEDFSDAYTKIMNQT